MDEPRRSVRIYDVRADDETVHGRRQFLVHLYALDESGRSYVITLRDYKPFFYAKVSSEREWTNENAMVFAEYVKNEVDLQDDVVGTVERMHKLYGYDAKALHTYVRLQFANLGAFQRAKRIWYEKDGILKPDGLTYIDATMTLYEAHIPPLLRLFHIRNISPSGWVSISESSVTTSKNTMCDFSAIVSYTCVQPENEKEDRVPYKVCSFDIEADSSHGDFPLPVKTFRKFAMEVVSYIENECDEPVTSEYLIEAMQYALVWSHYETHENYEYISPLYLKRPINDVAVVASQMREVLLEPLNRTLANTQKEEANKQRTLNEYFDEEEEDSQEEDVQSEEMQSGHMQSGPKEKKPYRRPTAYKTRDPMYKVNIVEFLNMPDASLESETVRSKASASREDKIEMLDMTLKRAFPCGVQGDKVTFIGSVFFVAGESDSYKDHCIALNTCSEIPGVELESYSGEDEVLLAWKELIQREKPDIIIGYNIFGFDYDFLFYRSLELGITHKFLTGISKNLKVSCYTRNAEGVVNIAESRIKIASGEHHLHYVDMPGCLQVDLYNIFRRDYNLPSYKLDYAASHFLGDAVRGVTQCDGFLVIQSKNLTGLYDEAYVSFEITDHSAEAYKNGAKFRVLDVDAKAGTFKVQEEEGMCEELMPREGHKVRWGLAKDDVTPQDIFRLTRKGPDERAIVAKYCVQDCRLPMHLFNKIDMLTGFIEMAKLCSVPISFIVMRGQGIKLTSYVAKKCREMNTLIPTISKSFGNEAYEGAIVLEPKTGIYLNEPIACVDYGSLYPSSMISDNISHDTKVSTEEYDTKGKLVRRIENFVMAPESKPGRDYVDIEYDAYKWVSRGGVKAVKTVVGKKVCRYIQADKETGEGLGIIPSILKELLAARKATRKLIPQQKDEFMRNVLDKRQLSIKVTANSIYGQCGAKTSTFYDMDVAASTTAIGRQLLMFAKNTVEKAYSDGILVSTEKHGDVRTHAECVYGDSVTGGTPVRIRDVNGNIYMMQMGEVATMFGNNMWYRMSERGNKEFCDLSGLETWSESGWTAVDRVIRHVLPYKKRVFRVMTHTGIVEVTEDHSLLRNDGSEVKPTEVAYGEALMHCGMKAEGTRLVSWEKAYQMGYECRQPPGEYEVDRFMRMCSRGTLSQLFSFDIASRLAFWYGLYNTRPEQWSAGEHHIYVFDTQLKAAVIYWLVQSFGMLCDVTTDLNDSWNKKEKMYRVHVVRTQHSIVDIMNPLYVSIQNAMREEDVKLKIHEHNLKVMLGKEEVNRIGEYVYDFTTENGHFAAGIGDLIVHNTDSVFVSFGLTDKDGKTKITGKRALEISIELGQKAGALVTRYLKAPHDLEYEKTFLPFILLSKKRYVGMLYETDIERCVRKSMGIVLKRRDNAPIVKDVYGGILDILIQTQDIGKAVEFLDGKIREIVEGRVPLQKLVITKSLRGNYANPKQIAHKVLADRIKERDPGNAPRAGDRIGYVHVHVPTKTKAEEKALLMGEKIELPEVVESRGLKVDSGYYLTNQIMNPVQQLFALVMEELKGFRALEREYERTIDKLWENSFDSETFEKKRAEARGKVVKKLLFDPHLMRVENVRHGRQEITNFFKRV